MTYLGIESAVACTRKPQAMVLGELGYYPPPVTWIDRRVRVFKFCPFKKSNSQFHNNTIYTFIIIYGLSRTLALVLFNHNLLKCVIISGTEAQYVTFSEYTQEVNFVSMLLG